MTHIDINCDMGEVPEAIASGAQEAIMPFLSSVNIACGGHAGDEPGMIATIQQATRWKLAIGAHPGYPDRLNFGRVAMEMSGADIARTVFEQVQLLAKVAEEQGAAVRHVKPHGALYNAAAANAEIARAIAAGVARWSKDVVLVGLAGSVMLEVFRDAGFRAAAEAFADRQYERDGSLRARRFADALIHDPRAAGRQVLDIVEEGQLTAIDGSRVAIDAQTICIHGDTAGAREIAAEVARSLEARDVSIHAFE